MTDITMDVDTKALRQRILTLAIQGKLTDQRKEDGTAQDLYNQIQEEKQKLIKEKKIKKEKPLPEITEDEIPFEIPGNWMWVRLGNLTSKIGAGNTPKGGKNSGVYKESGVEFIREMNVYNDGLHYDGMVYISNELAKTRTGSAVVAGDILLNITGGSIGRCALIPDTFALGNVNQHVLIIRNILAYLREYMHLVLCSPLVQRYINANAVGDKAGLSAAKTKGFVIPLPPLAEQKRIADKVSALFAQLDAIDKAYGEYRELQQAMKSRLLEQAIQGKLTDQRKEDGNAQDLYNQIQEEKQKLIKAKKIKKEKPLPEIAADEISFEIPENWMWVRLGEMILNHIGGGTPDKSNEAYWNGDIPWMSVKDVHQDSMYADRTIDSITPAGLENSSSNLIEANRLIVVMRMAVGRAVINKLPVAINQDLRALFFRDNVTQEYILRIFKILKFETSGMTVKGIKLWVLLNTPIPLPPLAEQKRIVEKLDKLLPLCEA